MTEARFKLFPSPPEIDDNSNKRPLAQATELTFLAGSNRYLLKTFLSSFFDDRGDKTFRSMLRHLEDSENQSAPLFTLFLGNQVYLDALGFNSKPTHLSEISKIYRDAFGQKYIRKLMRSLPVYMILNDHEVENTWSRDRLKLPDKELYYDGAISAYRAYQWLHGPRTFDDNLYYSFECGGYPFFVLDVRTQRFKGEPGTYDNHLLGQELESGSSKQFAALLTWLEKQNRVQPDWPKFIVSPSVFLPDHNRPTTSGSSTRGTGLTTREGDNWAAYPNTRKKLLRFIVEKGIQNVVFFTGSDNFSAVTEISFSGNSKAEQLRSFAINASSFFWPYPHPSKRQFVQDTSKTGGIKLLNDVQMHYKIKSFIADDGFARIVFTPAKRVLRVEFFTRKRKKLKSMELNLF